MLLSITTTYEPATDLGYLLHKNPERVQTTAMSFGQVHVVYPQADHDRCTAALLVEVDPVGLVRDRKGSKGNDFSLAQYVKDRPYAASSFLPAAINKVFGTALTGRSKERPELFVLLLSSTTTSTTGSAPRRSTSSSGGAGLAGHAP